MAFLITAFDFTQVPARCCPKCLEPRRQGCASCAKCGVLFERIDLNALVPPAWLRAEWGKVCQQWQHLEAHELLRKQALEQHEVQPLTRMYRLHLLRNPDDPQAQEALRAIARAGMVMVFGASYQATQKKQRLSPDVTGWRHMVRVFLKLIGVPLR